MHEHYLKVKEKYDEWQTYLLKKGQLLAKDTGIGYWGVTPLPETFELFSRINLEKFGSMLDMGSGDGRIVLLASLFGIDSHGIEFDEWLINSSLHIKNKLALPHFEKAKFTHDDYMNHDLSKYGLLYLNPDRPFFRNGLEPKLMNEMSGKLLVHGWEFHPEHLKKEDEHVINGEKFILYGK
jgi:hypothetical protein